MGFISNNLLKVIEWTEDDKKTIVYKYPMDGRSIMYGSKLTVREGQVAIFVNKGQIADIFEPGMHTLKASNIPILTQILALPYGFKSPFYSDVYFINTKQFTNQKWGTSTPITMRDAEFGTIRVKGYGKYAFKVNDSKLFLKEVFGTCASFSTDDINDYLRSLVVSSITDTIAESKIKALDLAGNLIEFSKIASDVAKTHFEEVGLKLTKLIVESFSFPEEVEKAIDANSTLSVLGDKMDDYMTYHSVQALKDSAKNQGTAGMGAGMATSFILADQLADTMAAKKAKSTTTPETGKFCPECGAKNRKNAKFCSECGKKFETKSNICAKCGAELSKTAKFCQECGTKR
ncbi:MAG: SPFH domain-containing protein [Clostridia bacterium]|nr:SPFH domain-containing protein [Clostridia bacterium]